LPGNLALELQPDILDGLIIEQFLQVGSGKSWDGCEKYRHVM
jgi:hypothetical protein